MSKLTDLFKSKPKEASKKQIQDVKLFLGMVYYPVQITEAKRYMRLDNQVFLDWIDTSFGTIEKILVQKGEFIVSAAYATDTTKFVWDPEAGTLLINSQPWWQKQILARLNHGKITKTVLTLVPLGSV